MVREQSGQAALHSAVPILRVRDLSSSIKYCVKNLGFKAGREHQALIASFSRDRCSQSFMRVDEGTLSPIFGPISSRPSHPALYGRGSLPFLNARSRGIGGLPACDESMIRSVHRDGCRCGDGSRGSSVDSWCGARETTDCVLLQKRKD